MLSAEVGSLKSGRTHLPVTPHPSMTLPNSIAPLPRSSAANSFTSSTAHCSNSNSSMGSGIHAPMQAAAGAGDSTHSRSSLDAVGGVQAAADAGAAPATGAAGKPLPSTAAEGRCLGTAQQSSTLVTPELAAVEEGDLEAAASELPLPQGPLGQTLEVLDRVRLPHMHPSMHPPPPQQLANHSAQPAPPQQATLPAPASIGTPDVRRGVLHRPGGYSADEPAAAAAAATTAAAAATYSPATAATTTHYQPAYGGLATTQAWEGGEGGDLMAARDSGSGSDQGSPAAAYAWPSRVQAAAVHPKGRSARELAGVQRNAHSASAVHRLHSQQQALRHQFCVEETLNPCAYLILTDAIAL